MFSRSLLLLLVPILLHGSAVAGDYSGYRIPRHHVFTLTGTVQGNFSFDDRNDPGSTNSYSQWNGQLGGTTFYLLDSDPYRSQLSGNFNLVGNSSKGDSRSPAPDSTRFNTSNSKSRSVSEDFWASWTGWAYPWSTPVGISGSVSGSGSYRQNWNTGKDTDYPDSAYRETHYESSNWTYSNTVDISAGPGYGRVRDASAVYAAHLLEQRLLDLGVLTSPLSDATMHKLTDLYYLRKTDYTLVYQRSSKDFWRDVEDVLRTDEHVKKDALNAFSLYRIAEAVDGGDAYRPVGFFIGPEISLSHSHYVQRQSSSYHTIIFPDSGGVTDDLTHKYLRDAQWRDQVRVGGQLEYHRPVGDRWQFDGEISAWRPLNNLPKAFTAYANVQIEYLIADRWRGDFWFGYSRDIEENKQGSYKLQIDSWNASASATLRYFVEDHLSVYAMVSHSQEKTRQGELFDDYTISYREFERTTTGNIGVAYHFFGYQATGAKSGANRPKI